VVTVNTDVWFPPTHSAVQLVQLLQLPVQLMGQGNALVQLVVHLQPKEKSRCENARLM
jgi:hypothetical protein